MDTTKKNALTNEYTQLTLKTRTKSSRYLPRALAIQVMLFLHARYGRKARIALFVLSIIRPRPAGLIIHVGIIQLIQVVGSIIYFFPLLRGAP